VFEASLISLTSPDHTHSRARAVRCERREPFLQTTAKPNGVRQRMTPWDREQRVGVIGDVHHDGTPSFRRISAPGNCLLYVVLARIRSRASSTRPVRMRIV
jgi:hypothetical protein